MSLTLTDLFCGAGGSSTGAIQVPGIEVRVASNHWQLAVETHNTNHADADHICADLSQIDPRYFPNTDLLWASPECTNHSVAKGKKRAGATPDLFDQILPDVAAERSRATMWDVPRFAETHRYRAVIVENVVDAAKWIPFNAWLAAMHSLGYRHQIVWLNSMHANYAGAGAAQSRDRMYVVFTLEGNPAPELHKLNRPLAICSECGPVASMQSWKKTDRQAWGRYRAQYVFRCPNVTCRNQIVEPVVRPAAEIIDWSLEGQRIGDRTRPLADKTMKRIQAGIERYWKPLLIEAAGNTYDSSDPRHPQHGQPRGYMRAWPTNEPVRTIHTTASKGLVVPVEGREGKSATAVTDPLRTMTTRNETGIAVPCGGTWREAATSLSDPLPTRTTVETDGLAFRTQFRERVRDLDPHREPLTTVVADGANHGVVQAPLFIAELRGGGSDARSTTSPLSTVTASGNHHALLMRNNGSRGSGAEHSTPVTEPARTMTTAGHQSLVDSQAPTINIDDVRFRMLEPSEIIRAMDFPNTYKVLGTRREQVRMAGNAVTPCAARDLIAVVAESLGGVVK